MALITHSFIPSKKKENKGTEYPRFRINLQNGSKPFFKPYKDVLIYKRANTPDKQKTNDTNKKMIKAIHKELQEQYKGSEYSNVAKGTATLDEHLVHMLVLKGDLTRNTQKGYETAFKSIKRFCEEKGYNVKMDINKVNLQFVDEYRIWLVSEAKYAGDTALKYFVGLGTALKKAKQYGKLYHNPFDEGVEYPKSSDEEMVYLTPDEVTRMMKTECRLPLVKDAFMFMIFTGIRSQDCKSLIWRNLPIIDSVVNIQVKTQKRKTDIFFPIPPQANNYLPKKMGDDDLVFPNYKTESYHNDALREWALKSDVKKHIVPHTARHSFSAYMLSKGTPLYTLSKLLGHTNARTTEDRYGHLSKEDTDKAVRKAFRF